LPRPLTNLVLFVAEFGDGIAIEGERSFPDNGTAECFHGGTPSLAHAGSPRKVEQSFIFDSVESKAARSLLAFYSRLFRFFYPPQLNRTPDEKLLADTDEKFVIDLEVEAPGNDMPASIRGLASLNAGLILAPSIVAHATKSRFQVDMSPGKIIAYCAPILSVSASKRARMVSGGRWKLPPCPAKIHSKR
jgi:hypothetical protein